MEPGDKEPLAVVSPSNAGGETLEERAGVMEPLAIVSPSSAGGETLEERARLNCCLQIEFPEA